MGSFIRLADISYQKSEVYGQKRAPASSQTQKLNRFACQRSRDLLKFMRMRLDELKKLHISAFPGDEAYAEYFFRERFDASHAFTLSADGKIVSAAYARIIEAEIYGKVLEIPLLTGVATHPDYRYRGFASRVIRDAETRLKEEGYPFVMLHPFNADFYAALGYAPINGIGRFCPKPYGPGGVAEALTPEDWSETFSVYSEWASSSPAHVFRSASVQKEHIGMFLKYCGSGYLIRLNGSPVAYVLIENGKAVEAMFTRPDAFDGVTETLSLALPLALSEEGGYSMAKLLNLKSLFRLLPMRGVDSDARFGLSGKTYQLIINNDCFVSLTETSGKAYELTPAELLRTALGHGKEYPLSPIGSLFPEYGLAVFEKY